MKKHTRRSFLILHSNFELRTSNFAYEKNSRDAVNHRVDVHPGADRGEDDVVAGLQRMPVELAFLDQIEHGRKRSHRTVPEPGDRHRHDVTRWLFHAVELVE